MSAPEPVSVEIRRGRPTDDELAAIVAVVTEAYTEESAAAVVTDVPSRSRWRLSARGLRTPLPRERGWGGAS